MVNKAKEAGMPDEHGPKLQEWFAKESGGTGAAHYTLFPRAIEMVLEAEGVPHDEWCDTMDMIAEALFSKK